MGLFFGPEANWHGLTCAHADKRLSFQNRGAASELPVVMLFGPGCPWTMPRHCLGEFSLEQGKIISRDHAEGWIVWESMCQYLGLSPGLM